MLLKVIFVCSNMEKCFAVQSQVGALGPTLQKRFIKNGSPASLSGSNAKIVIGPMNLFVFSQLYLQFQFQLCLLCLN